MDNDVKEVLVRKKYGGQVFNEKYSCYTPFISESKLNEVLTTSPALRTNESDLKSQMSQTPCSRTSLLDAGELARSQSKLRGIMYFMWLLAVLCIINIVFKNLRNYYFFEDALEFDRKSDWMVGLNVFNNYIFNEQAYRFIGIEIAMLMSLFLSYFFQTLVTREILKGANIVNYGKYFIEASIFSGILLFIYQDVSRWSFVQLMFIVLHTFAMLMKIHSYLSVNDQLHRIYLSTGKRKPVFLDVGYYEKCIHNVSDDDYPITEGTSYPKNVNIRDFIRFLLIPSILYHTNFPRKQKINPYYLVEKIFSGFISLSLTYVIAEYWILPTLLTYSQSVYLKNVQDDYKLHVKLLFMFVFELLLPFILACWLLFYFMLECLCNFHAEVTGFTIRNFYDDWWNSVDFEEFSRKWNKPVHHFLYIHVYKEFYRYLKARSIKKSIVFESNRAIRLSKVFTFCISSIFHELCLWVVCKIIFNQTLLGIKYGGGGKSLVFMQNSFKTHFFLCQMLQIPLIYIARKNRRWLSNNVVCGNLILLIGITLGIPLLFLLYCSNYFWHECWRLDGTVFHLKNNLLI